MKILVTGGAGFIGYHLCSRLLAEGHTVICLDNLSTGSETNLAMLREHCRLVSVFQDVRQVIDHDAEQIYHLACPASPKAYQADPIYTLETAIFGTVNCLRLAEKTGARMLLASTSEVYGDPEVHPQSEDYWGHVNPVGSRSCYDEGKRAAEAFVHSYVVTGRVDARIVRIFNTYGPNMRADDGRVISNMITQALRGEDLDVFGDGDQTRSFCYVDDLVDGLIRAMNHPKNPGVLNLGNPEEWRIESLARLIISLTGAASSIRYVPLPEDDPKRRCPDITRARKELGWEPRVPLREGLPRTIAFFAKTGNGRG